MKVALGQMDVRAGRPAENWRRAQAAALNIVVIHLVGDVPSPFLIGWISDLSSLKWGVSLTLVALAAGAVLILTAIPYLPADLAAAGETHHQERAPRHKNSL